VHTLFATSLIQVAASFAVSGPLAISVAIVAQAHLPESWIGYYTSLIYLSAMAGSLLTPRLLTLVDVGRIQLGGLVATGVGYALFSQIERGGAGLALAIAGIVMMGLAYGVIVPASALMLSDRFARQWQPMVVSIRQTGVPVGTALVALIAPLVVQHWGWTSMSYVVGAAVVLTFILSAAPMLRMHARQAATLPAANLIASLRTTFAHPATLRLALVSGFYGLNQAALTTYLVPSLVWLHAMSIGRAAGFLAIATAAGAGARILFGLTTSRFGQAYGHLRMIGFVSGVAWTLMLWPAPSNLRLIAGAALLGATAMGWNGILLAQLAQDAPPGKTADAVGAGTALAYFGVLVAPFIYVAILVLSHDKTVAIASIVALSIVAGTTLLRRTSARD
jgi:Major Facilitator Superfamily